MSIEKSYCQRCGQECTGEYFGFCREHKIHPKMFYKVIVTEKFIAIPSPRTKSMWELPGGIQITTRKLNKLISDNGLIKRYEKIIPSAK